MGHSTSSLLTDAGTTRDPGSLDLPAVLEALDTMVASAEPAVVFSCAVRLCVPLIGAYATVSIREPEGLAYAITSPGNPTDLDPARTSTPSSRSTQSTPITGEPTGIHPGYSGTLTLHLPSPPTAEHAALAKLVVDRATALVDRERLSDLVVDATTRAEQLTGALVSNREIGMAVGIVMGLDKVTRECAFDVLRSLSQRTHRKLRDIATDVIETGTSVARVEGDPPAADGAGRVAGDRPGRRFPVRCAS